MAKNIDRWSFACVCESKTEPGWWWMMIRFSGSDGTRFFSMNYVRWRSLQLVLALFSILEVIEITSRVVIYMRSIE
jgi:hypothetical protein